MRVSPLPEEQLRVLSSAPLHTCTGDAEGQMSVSTPRTFVSLGADAAAEVIEDFGPALGGAPTFTNAVLEVSCGTAHRLLGRVSSPSVLLFRGTVLDAVA